MRVFMRGLLVGAVVLGISGLSAWAYHCPVLVKECEAVVVKLDKRPDAKKDILAQAKKMCTEAAKLHDDEQHADSMIKAGEAIALASRAVK
jgi:hypothetical protein